MKFVCVGKLLSLTRWSFVIMMIFNYEIFSDFVFSIVMKFLREHSFVDFFIYVDFGVYWRTYCYNQCMYIYTYTLFSKCLCSPYITSWSFQLKCRIIQIFRKVLYVEFLLLKFFMYIIKISLDNFSFCFLGGNWWFLEQSNVQFEVIIWNLVHYLFYLTYIFNIDFFIDIPNKSPLKNPIYIFQKPSITLKDSSFWILQHQST